MLQLCSASSARLDSRTAAASNSGVIGAIEPLKASKFHRYAPRCRAALTVPEQKAARKAAAARARTLCKPVWRHVSDAVGRPVRNQQNPYADKSCRARCTPNGPARARRRRVALPEATGGTADAAPRAAGVPRDRAEDRDRGQPPRTQALALRSDQWQSCRPTHHKTRPW